jgi:hypothetical protein
MIEMSLLVEGWLKSRSDIKRQMRRMHLPKVHNAYDGVTRNDQAFSYPKNDDVDLTNGDRFLTKDGLLGIFE